MWGGMCVDVCVIYSKSSFLSILMSIRHLQSKLTRKCTHTRSNRWGNTVPLIELYTQWHCWTKQTMQAKRMIPLTLWQMTTRPCVMSGWSQANALQAKHATTSHDVNAYTYYPLHAYLCMYTPIAIQDTLLHDSSWYFIHILPDTKRFIILN